MRRPKFWAFAAAVTLLPLMALAQPTGARELAAVYRDIVKQYAALVLFRRRADRGPAGSRP
jgi:hypothetical protein